MRRFAELLERLAFTPARNGKLRLLADYLRDAPDPDRGWGIAAITRDLTLDAVKPAMLRAITEARVDPELLALSHDFVGDLAETIALIWPAPETPPPTPRPPTRPSPRSSTPSAPPPAARRRRPSSACSTASTPAGRFALLKLVTGGLRVGVSARLAKQALADFGARDVTEIEELWHGLAPPYVPLFAWLAGTAPRPTAAATPFRPVMLSHALDEADLARLDPADFAAEWKWDGIRVQAAADAHGRRLYSRTGDDIGARLPRPPRRPRLRRRPRRRTPRPPRRRLDRHLLRPAAAPEPQDRHPRPAPPLPRAPARLRPPPARPHRPPPAPLRRAPRRPRSLRPDPRPHPRRPLPAPPLRHLGRPRRASAPPRPTRSSRA